LHAAEEEHRDDRRGEARLIAVQHFQDDVGDRVDEGEAAGRKAQVRGEAQRHLAKRGDAVDGKREHLRERVFRRAGKTFVAIVLDADLVVADPTHEAANEAMRFARSLECIDDAPTHQTEVPGVDRNRHVRETARDPIEEACGKEFEGALATARAPGRIHDVVARPPALDKLRDEFGGILKIAIHQDDGIADRDVESRGCGELVTEVS